MQSRDQQLLTYAINNADRLWALHSDSDYFYKRWEDAESHLSLFLDTLLGRSSDGASVKGGSKSGGIKTAGAYQLKKGETLVKTRKSTY